MNAKYTQLLLILVVSFLNSCSELIRVTGGTPGEFKPFDLDKVQTVTLRSRYKVECTTITELVEDFIRNNKEITTGSPDVGNLCHEIDSQEDVFKSCIKVEPQNEYRIVDGGFWTNFDFYLIQVQKKESDCNLFLYTWLAADLKGNPLVQKPYCQNGFGKLCEEGFEAAKLKRDKIKSSIEKRSKIVFGPAIEEKIFNYYSTEKALKAFEK